MGRKRKQLIAVAASAAFAVTLAGCGGGSSGGGASPEQTRSTVTKGGTLYYLVNSVIDHLDPQRIYTGRDITNFDRTLYRSLVTFPAGETDPVKGNTPVPDLATDTGTSSDGGKVWKFTIKDGVKWQDGSPITCADFAYGASRTFASDVITGGPNYIIGYLDVPRDPSTDAPLYDGPYKGDGQAGFDKAITCDGNTITYNFRKPFPDFPLAIASLPAFDPFKKSEDKGDKSNYEAFSDGPYMLQGTWDPDKGGTLVRNPMWDASTDTVRQANPDTIDFELGFDPATEQVIKRLIADKGDDMNAIAASSIPPDQFPNITGDVAARTVNVESPFTNYLLPNFNRLTNLKVRQALAAATNRAAYSQALGGTKVSAPAVSIVNPAVPGFKANPAYSADGKPDLTMAKSLLKEAGVQLPYPIKFTYPKGSEASDAAFAALKDSYDQAGFTVTLDGLDPSTNYYPTIQNPGSDSDLTWGGWGADWPSINTVIPPLFDSRINLISKTSNGQDYGNFKNDSLNQAMDAAGAETDLTKSAEDFSQVDATLAAEVGYIPLDTTKFYYLRGGNIENYVNSVGSSAYPDLGVISLKDGK